MPEEFKLSNTETNKLWNKIFGTEYTVESMDYYRKKKGVKYTIHHQGNDTWFCDCMSWRCKSGVQTVEMLDTGKKHERTCKHIRFVMKNEGLRYKILNYWV